MYQVVTLLSISKRVQ